MPAAYCLRGRRGNWARAACYRVRTILQLSVDHGALDLGLSLFYTVLLLVLIGVSYLSLTRRTKRK